MVFLLWLYGVICVMRLFDCLFGVGWFKIVLFMYLEIGVNFCLIFFFMWFYCFKNVSLEVIRYFEVFFRSCIKFIFIVFYWLEYIIRLV